jgi:hypothetical protein
MTEGSASGLWLSRMTQVAPAHGAGDLFDVLFAGAPVVQAGQDQLLPVSAERLAGVFEHRQPAQPIAFFKVPGLAPSSCSPGTANLPSGASNGRIIRKN